MSEQTDFDLWAASYDQNVTAESRQNNFPFAGYSEILEAIEAAVSATPRAKILDLGVGTGILAQRLYVQGHDLTGIDFSQAMLEIAAQKIPEALLLQHDFRQGFPPELEAQRYDYIIATYALHHLVDEVKAPFLRDLLTRVHPHGAVLIGDIAFQTRAELEALQGQISHLWDEGDYYWVADEVLSWFPAHQVSWKRFSYCAGLFTLKILPDHP